METASLDDIDDDLNRFCEDMEQELNEISGIVKEKEPPRVSAQQAQENFLREKEWEQETERQRAKAKAETTIAASPWGLSLFSSFASSATKSMSATFSPLSKDLSSISSLATSATKALSDTLSGGGLYDTPEQKHKSGGGADLTALAQTPEALEKLRRIQAEHDAKRSEMTYACLMASRSAREVAVPARSVTEIPVTVPAGKEISWKFQVKHYDIVFGVKLRVQHHDSGEWTEHVLVPPDLITSEDLVDESCCSERCVRKFIFSLDNNIAMIYSKTVAFDIVLLDDPDCWRDRGGGGHSARTPQGSHEQELQSSDSTGLEEEEEPRLSESARNLFSSPSGGVQEEWAVYHNEEGQAYYYNHHTGESQWERPEGVETSWSDSSTAPEQGQCQGQGQERELVLEEEAESEEDSMAVLMLKLSQGVKTGQLTAEQRQDFMTDIIECRDLAEVLRDLNDILARGSASGAQ